MSTLSRVDPELVEALADVPPYDCNAETLAALRERPGTLAEPTNDGLEVEHRTIAGPADALEVRVLIFRRPASTDKRPALLYIHGGGFVMGSPESMTARPRQFAAEVDCVVVSTSYRLAPETRWPGAVEDCYQTLCWMHDNADELGIDRDRIAIYGESAGGGHAAALALYARDRGGPKICLQLLSYPMLDDRTEGKTNPATGEFLWTRASDRFGWTSLLGVPAGSDEVPAGSVPARVEDLSGLPPTFMCTAELDLFCDEDVAYARRLSIAGVPTGLFVAPAAYHGFDHFVPDAAVSKLYFSTMLLALEAAFRQNAPAHDLLDPVG